MIIYFKSPDDPEGIFTSGLPEGIRPTEEEMLEIEHKLSYDIKQP